MNRPLAPLLSQDLIAETTLVLVDEIGLDRFSMRRLAARLDVQAASIYSHFANKDELLDAVANILIRSVDTSDFGAGWKAGLLTWGRSYRALLEAHPHAVPIIAAGAGKRADFLEMANAVQGGLVRAGWPARYATMISASVKFLVIGSAITPFASGFSDDASVYIGRYPHLQDAHRIPRARRIDADSFELALNALIAGLEAVEASLELQDAAKA